MAVPSAPERLRISPRSGIAAVALFGLTLVLLRVAVSAFRVLGWIAVAATLAALLHPAVMRLARRMPRGLAVATVAVSGVAVSALVGYTLVDAVSSEAARLERAAPDAVRRLERDSSFAKFARDARLAERTERFLAALPERLRGGTPAEALRAAATRVVAYLATAVLALFFLLHGARMASGGLRQIRDPARRQRVHDVAVAAYRRGFGYARGSLAMAAGAGAVAYGLARLGGVPGAAPLALWVGLWDLVPVLGAAVGAVPIIVLGGVGNTGRGLALTAAFVAYQVLENMVLQRRLERATIRVGPFLTAAAGLVGLELYGIGGALMAVLVMVLAVSALDETAPAA